ncbi:MFS general substrate transporter [Microstroma glucosiphilum]|uniref:MFS general substrate transporter n=1 Tax=Pseudomicrostroma glucosiphilum TaxID=1684307 RepID=A0A316U920_9BASI|nr:MFS general substrate transporter [Pseudomicrostroma glucosiphilum]PWN21328.1 MFS general substrate transporter [Pseudomicrostroma glucosiphilum]
MTVVNTPSKGGSETGQSESGSPSYKAGQSATAKPTSGDQALAQGAPAVTGAEVKGDTIWVDFPAGDPEDPFNFSQARKWFITILAVFFTAEVAATASAYVPGISQMETDLNVTNHELGLLGISIYALGFGIPPLALAPFSEVFGRRNVYIASHLAYTLFFLCCGLAQNMTTMLLGRFFGGAFGSTGSTLVGGTLADIWRTNERGFPMALFATAAIFGTGFGPVWAGWVAQHESLGWRWIQYIQAIFTSGGLLLLVFFFRETRGSVILTRRAARLRKETGDERYRARAEAERASIPVLIKDSLTRPLWLLVSEPIVIAFSLWISFLWGVMYSLLESLGLIADLHGYTLGQEGLLFLSIVAAAILGLATNPIQDRLYNKNFSKRGPEARLYLAMISAVTFPIGAFIYAWTSYPDVSIAGTIIGVIVFMWSVFNVYLAVFNYLADSYLIFASSALAAQSFARNMFGLAFPLFTEQMYHNLGYQWASSLAGFLGAALGVVPFVLFIYGDRIRAKSRFSMQLLELEKKREAEAKQQQEKVDLETSS